MAHNLKLYTDDGATLVTDITFTGVTPGTRSSGQTFRVVNDDSGGTVDPATDPYLVHKQRDTVTDEPLLRGLRAVDERWLEVEATGTSSADVSQPPTGIEPIGRGRVLPLVSLPSGAWVEVVVYYHPPTGAPEGSVRLTLDAETTPAWSVDQGHSESDRDGIIAGIGDGLHTELVIGGTLTATGTPDEFVNHPDVAWVHEGIPQVLLAGAIEFDDVDASAATLGAGEAKWERLSLGAGPGFTQTPSDKFATGSADPDDVPAVPEGEIDCGYVLVDDTLAIDNADITSRLWAGRAQPAASSLILTVGSFKARVDNALIRRTARPTITLPGSEAAVSVWVLPDGNLAYTDDGSKPDPRALLLYTVPTDVSSITLASLVDYREPIGPVPVPVVLTWDATLTNGLKARGVWPLARPGKIRIPRGVIYRWHDAGAGNSAGIAKADVDVNGTTIFTSSGSIDRRPSLEHDSSPLLSTAGLPEALDVPPFALIEGEIVITEAFNGTAPGGATLVLMVDPS